MTQSRIVSPPVRTQSADVVEVSWFAPLCSDDFEYLGIPDARYKSSYQNTASIARAADTLGFNNMLCPSSYQVGQDTLTFAAALAPQLQQMSLLAAVRCGELHPPMLARTLATLDHMLPFTSPWARRFSWRWALCFVPCLRAHQQHTRWHGFGVGVKRFWLRGFFLAGFCHL